MMDLNGTSETIKVIGGDDLLPEDAVGVEITVGVEKLAASLSTGCGGDWWLITSIRDTELLEILIGIDSASPDNNFFNISLGNKSAKNNIACHTVTPERNLVGIDGIKMLERRVSVEGVNDII